MPTPHRLPAGLTPVQVGRMGLWLLGKRNQARARRRTYEVTRALEGHTLNRRWVRLVCRWSIAEYPGWIRAFASALGLEPRTAKAYLMQRNRLPVKHAVRLLELSREYRSEWDELIIDLEAYVAERKPKARGAPRNGGKTG
jgi:hypothetical protein